MNYIIEMYCEGHVRLVAITGTIYYRHYLLQCHWGSKQVSVTLHTDGTKKSTSSCQTPEICGNKPTNVNSYWPSYGRQDMRREGVTLENTDTSRGVRSVTSFDLLHNLRASTSECGESSHLSRQLGHGPSSVNTHLLRIHTHMFNPRSLPRQQSGLLGLFLYSLCKCQHFRQKYPRPWWI